MYTHHYSTTHVVSLFSILLGAILFIFPNPSFAAGLTNAGFETGDFTGWTVVGDAEVVESYVAKNGYGMFVGPTYYPKEGSKFAVLKTGLGTGVYSTISQTKFLTMGETISGWAAFDAVDYLPYNDDAAVVVEVNGIVGLVWSKDIAAVGDYGESEWEHWSFTAPYSGLYTITLKVRNVGDNILDSYALFDGDGGESVEPSEFWSEISSGKGSLILRDSPNTSANALKQLPDGWVVWVTNTKKDDGSIAEQDGYRWYQVKDETDGTTGWMAAGKWVSGDFLSEEDEYLKYNVNTQVDSQKKAQKIYSTRSERAGQISALLNHYYDASNTGTFLMDGVSNAYLKNNQFPIQIIAAMTLQESGGINFDNEWVTYDYGHGIKQVTTQEHVGKASKIRIPECEGVLGRKYCYEPINSIDDKSPKRYTIQKRYYTNTLLGMAANIKDGIANLTEKHKSSMKAAVANKTWILEYPLSSGVMYSVSQDEMRIMRTVRGYNGFGFKRNDDGEADFCYRFEVPDRNNYLTPVANQLVNTTNVFPTIPTDVSAQFAEKMKAVELHKTEVSLCSPGMIRIIDGDGNVVDQTQDNIPTAVYDESGKAAVVYLADDSYKFQVVGTEDGTYSLYLDNNTPVENSTVQIHDMPLSLGQVYTYQVDWDALARGERGVTISIDNDGDGVNEKTIQVGAELTSDELNLLTATTIDVDPNTLNRKNTKGIMTVYIELPEGFDVNNIDRESITLNGKPANTQPMTVGDYDADGISDLMVKFNRSIIVPTLPSTGTTAKLHVSGRILHNGKMLTFGGDDVVKLVQ